MAFQVLARKWRPQRFDDVIGQKGVTQTLRNAIAAQRIAQSFVFSGPRGVGKTTTARILARALNCQQGPTADPCGECDACLEIADGRDIDVIEIDAATNTQVDKVRAVIIDGLGMAPVRNKYKIFIIDEVHRLSPQSFDALLKSIEEPPPHVVFMMATTEIDKVPPTIQSRSQVFELKTIGVKQIADQLRAIAAAEKIAIDDAALMLIARAGDGSMRDAQSAFDQIIGFAGTTITADDVSTVLGLVRRDLLIAIADAVGRDDAAAVFDLAAQAVDSGYDLRLVVRELARMTRDLLILSIDPARVSDPGDRGRSRASGAARSVAAVLGRGPDARVRRADEGGIRDPRLDAAALPAGDGAAALDSPAQAGAAHRFDQTARRRGGPRRDACRGACPARAGEHRRAARGTSGSGSAGTCESRAASRRAESADRSRLSWAPAASPPGSAQTVKAVEAKRAAAGGGGDAAPESEGGRSGDSEGQLPERGPQGEEVLLRHGRRAGAEDRVRRRQGRVHVRAAAPRAAGAAGPEPAVARNRGEPARRTEDHRRRGGGFTGTEAVRRRRAARR